MRLVTPSRLAALIVSGAIIGGFGLALVRGGNVSVRIPSKEELQRNSFGELPRPPLNLARFLEPGVPERSRTVALVTLGPALRVNQPEARTAPDAAVPSRIPTPAPMAEGPTTDHSLYLDEVLRSVEWKTGDTAVLRLGVLPGEDGPRLFPRPREGDRLLMVLVPQSGTTDATILRSYPYNIVDISGPKGHFLDAWTTSVKEMGAPEPTPAFIEAVLAALAGPR